MNNQEGKLRKQYHLQLHQKKLKIPQNKFNQGCERLVLEKL